MKQLNLKSSTCLALLAVLLLLLVAPAQAAPNFNPEPLPGEPTDWHGFKKYAFEVDGRPCFVVAPREASPGRPWVWRARFPSFHAEADLILLERGFHIAYMNTDGMFGSDKALDHWDKFYDTMTQKHGFIAKVALEGVSRGGLFIYRWAARNPDKVACIYADTPVCDIKSWPGGKGAGRGDAGSWKKLQEQYNLTEEEAMKWEENPIDVLEPIAKAKIPLLTIVSLNDEIVPPKENTFLLAERFRKLDGQIEIIEVEKGTEKSGGHHFDHPDPRRVADWIEHYAIEANPFPMDR